MYLVQSTPKPFPRSGDWTTVLETHDPAEARVATTSVQRPDFWRRLIDGDTVRLARTRIKPRITGSDGGRWQVAYLDAQGFGGAHWPAGPWSRVYADVLRGHHEQVQRHGVLHVDPT
jgi:hypothetical protein